MSKINIDRVVATLDSRMQKYAVTLTDFKKITPTLARVVLTTINTGNLSKYDLRQAIAASTNGSCTPIVRSFYEVKSYGLPAIVGFVQANREVRAYEEAAVKKMRVLAKNMLMDAADDSLWQVSVAGDGQKMLTRQTQDDLSSILSSVQQSVVRAPRIAQLASAANLGDAVAYIDTKAEVTRFGFVMASETTTADGEAVLDVVNMPNMDGDTPEEQMQDQDLAFSMSSVPESMVVAAISMPTRFFAKEIAKPFDEGNLNSLREYYSKLYRYNPEYVNLMLKNIDNMAAA